MEMSKVRKCEVSDCAYNMGDICHTMAITVGDGMNPRCDTFCQLGIRGGKASFLAGVGACKVAGCTYNTDLECAATEVCIGYKDDEPNCMTFRAR